MAKKYYAVAKGRKPGIYHTWSDCQHQVSGFSNARFKSFKNKADAVAFISNTSNKHWIAHNGQAKRKLKLIPEITEMDLSAYDLVVYTDGGRIPQHPAKPAAWSFLILKQTDEGLQKISRRGGKRGATNNQMEIEAVYQAMLYLDQAEFNHSKILFCLDSKYVLGGLLKITQMKKNEDMWNRLNLISATFDHTDYCWVHGHGGEPGNEFVDGCVKDYMQEQITEFNNRKKNK